MIFFVFLLKKKGKKAPDLLTINVNIRAPVKAVCVAGPALWSPRGPIGNVEKIGSEKSEWVRH